MAEIDGKLTVRADLPGMEKDDINVEIKDNRLTIQGERKNELEEEKEGFYRSERSYGGFCRSLALPENANIDDANATFKNGVLEVTIATPQLAESGKRLEIGDESTEAKTASSGS